MKLTTQDNHIELLHVYYVSWGCLGKGRGENYKGKT